MTVTSANLSVIAQTMVASKLLSARMMQRKAETRSTGTNGSDAPEAAAAAMAARTVDHVPLNSR